MTPVVHGRYVEPDDPMGPALYDYDFDDPEVEMASISWWYWPILIILGIIGLVLAGALWLYDRVTDTLRGQQINLPPRG